MKCTTRCQCGTKKTCKNRAVEVQPVNRNPSAYARRQRTVEESQSEIQVNYKLACFTSYDVLMMERNWLTIC